MNEAKFWSLIEEAWQVVGGKTKARNRLAAGQLTYEAAVELESLLNEVIPALEDRLDYLSAKELMAFDRILERKLYNLDRSKVHAATDGSDDGFLYARGFIVAVGQAYYDAVNHHPATALMELDCEGMCYLSWHLYEEKFGEMEPSGISRESFSNSAGWKE